MWLFIQNQVLGMQWLNEVVAAILQYAGVDVQSRVGGSLQFFFYDVVKITVLLCVLIFLISYIQSYFPPERSRKIMGRFRGIWANIMGALLGTVTPFCSCSSIPLFMGFTSAGLPLGVTFSFLISSPMVDLGSLVLLISIFGYRIAVAYVVFGLIIAVIGGSVIERLHMEAEFTPLYDSCCILRRNLLRSGVSVWYNHGIILQGGRPMRDLKNTCRVAVVQATPVMFRKDKCLEKALRLIDEAAGEGAELIVFPELFIPGYPYGMTFGFTVGSRKAVGREDWKMYYDNSLLADGPEMRKLLRRARELDVYISMGYSERDAVTGTLYNANMMISPEGEALNHRKLKPTGSERVVWGDADRDYFPVMDTPWGPMGNLICWESYMPLARVALYQKGISLYISPNTNDNPEWQDTIRHIAIEGHCYFINADLVFRRSDYPQTVSGTAEIAALPDIACRGGSCVIDPFGHEASVTVWDKEDIIYADLDMQKVPASRMELDCVGHYARPDVLELRVNEK